MCYCFPNVRSEEQDVVTLAGFAMPFRAPGFPQGSFALESALDELSDRLGLDPLEVRRKNCRDQPAKALLLEYDLAAKEIGWSRRRSPAQSGAGGAGGRGLGLGTAGWGVYGGGAAPPPPAPT